MEESTFAQTPVALTRLRACKTCKLIKTYDQFYADFCENCPQKRPETVTAGNRADFVQTETTSDYEGMVTMLQPSHSWVARWLRMYSRTDDGSIMHVKTGLYAIKLPGEEAAAAAARYGGGDRDADEYEDEEADAGEEDASGSSSKAAPSAAGGAAAGKRITEDEEEDDDDDDDDEDDDSDEDSSGSSDDEDDAAGGKGSGGSATAAAAAPAVAASSGSASAPLIPGVTGPARQVSARDRDDPAARDAAVAQASIAPDGDE